MKIQELSSENESQLTTNTFLSDMRFATNRMSERKAYKQWSLITSVACVTVRVISSIFIYHLVEYSPFIEWFYIIHNK